MNNREKIKVTRNILDNAINMNIRADIVLKISQKLDKYIVEYYNKDEVEKENE
ncbi:aspartyl-phosphate phosphatase Spo0E family protein [Serpentinicella sp. ANB-PHB4]|uniref:aspartyl-phosphate phosphatase Spo0E family protein n=1 Tax=Serpentinicella sp. ANB-PHB4 TaxID=3074076 RepID=UPI002862FD06|nr:aspartyl-phosphate phosphatase Spo0E family protein [Serpentinicella sp. ANB-PHB4]MDR5659650.1 aspartyl-phosphate phosphatase Spo0E family protein [Serpentinicella sp. ANB-PHB4]